MQEVLVSGPVLTVSELTSYLRATLIQDSNLQDLWVRGEVSSVSLSRSGHLFFSLKDSGALLKCVVWAPVSYRMRNDLADGQEVLARGRLDIYAQQGVYQLYAEEVLPVGLGLSYLEFQRVKRALEAEGLFAPERKRPLPAFPKRLGLVTSAYGAALHDIENVISRRWPCVEVLLAATTVQGDGAPDEIVAALRLMAGQPVDVVILARGGGAKEDLSCFNHEQVARAIADMPMPVVTGIGHETDFTIADFVADYRAPTPSAAAAAAVPDRETVAADVGALERRLISRAGGLVGDHRQAVRHSLRVLRRSSPQHLLDVSRLSLDERAASLAAAAERSLLHSRHDVSGLATRLRAVSPRLDLARSRLEATSASLPKATMGNLHTKRQRLAALEQRLGALDPAATLRRGYAIVRRLDLFRTLVTTVVGLRAGESLTVQLHDGQVPVMVARAAGAKREKGG